MGTPPRAEINIYAYFRNLGGVDSGGKHVRGYTLPFMPDVFRMTTKSLFDQTILPLTSSQLLTYRSSPPQNISFTVKLVAGIDKIKSVATPNPQSLKESRYGDLLDLCKQLHGLSLPEDPSFSEGSPPPKIVLTIGALLKASGAFESVEVAYTGPYDEFGMSQEAEVTFTFLPSQFYDPINRVGIFGVGDDSTAKGLVAASQRDQNNQDSAEDETTLKKDLGSINDALKLGPSGLSSLDGDVPYVVSWGSLIAVPPSAAGEEVVLNNPTRVNTRTQSSSSTLTETSGSQSRTPDDDDHRTSSTTAPIGG